MCVNRFEWVTHSCTGQGYGSGVNNTFISVLLTLRVFECLFEITFLSVCACVHVYACCCVNTVVFMCENGRRISWVRLLSEGQRWERGNLSLEMNDVLSHLSATEASGSHTPPPLICQHAHCVSASLCCVCLSIHWRKRKRGVVKKKNSEPQWFGNEISAPVCEEEVISL